MRNLPQLAKIPEVDGTSSLLEHGEEYTNAQPPPHMTLLGAAAFDYLIASEEVVESFAILLGE